MKYKGKLRKGSFTLVEMLVVVGIASLLFTLVIPAFGRMMQGSRVEQCATGLRLGMERARGRAVSDRRYVALVLPHGVTGTSREDYKYQRGGYRLVYVTANGTGSYSYGGMIPETDWENKSSDAFLVAVDESLQKISSFSSVKVGAKDKSEKIKGINKLYNISDVPVGSGTDSLPGVIFTPYGDIKLDSDKTELYFYICGSDKEDMLCLRMNKLTGKIEFAALEI